MRGSKLRTLTPSRSQLPVRGSPGGSASSLPRRTPWGRAHQIMDGRMAGAHLGKDFLGGDAPIHDPDAPGFAVLVFDLLQEAPKGLVLSAVLPASTS